MNAETTRTWHELVGHFRELSLLEGVRAALGWDQQTYLPAAGSGERGMQLALLMQLQHERLVDPRVLPWLDALSADSSVGEAEQAGVRNLRRLVEREARVPGELVSRLGKLQSDGFTAWIDAKQRSDFSAFAPLLEQLLDISIERASHIAPGAHPYDTLLEEYDPGTTVASLRAMFGRLREGLTELLGAIGGATPIPARPIAMASARQLPIHKEVAAALGYNFTGGRLDFAEHPFTIALGTGDVRITTHLHDDDLLGGLSGTIHETGHGLYEQGLPRHLVGTGLESPASMGLHESQSRFWENQIGRSRPFLGWLIGKISNYAPDHGLDVDGVYREANRVHPGLIRIYADEVTYNLHIIVRFELELDLFEKRVAVRDLPEAWNARYREYLGVTPPDDARGVLQDVHWSGAAFGYFPSYTLGNLYSASLTAAMEQALPDMWDGVGRGEFTPILSWLRENVHRHGHRWDAPEIVSRAVGERDAVEDFLSHLWRRHGALYGVSRPRR
jgi:carboxypeptidase Taq